MRFPVKSLFAPALIFLTVSSVTFSADDSVDKAKDSELSLERLKLMQNRMAAVKVSSAGPDVPAKFSAKPIFRYSDPARGYVSAAVWKLGDEGRPRAIITTELHRQFHGKPRIVYEFLSLTPNSFSAASKDFNWSPQETDIEFRPIPDAPEPDESPQRRLLQLKQIAKRFAGNELVDKQQCELRLLPQPIDRYTPSTVARADGAVFLLTFGTNPEVALFLESDGKAWSYAAGRLAGATEISLTIDGDPAWSASPVKYGMDQAYTANNTVADIPGIAPDGSEIRE